MTHYGHFVAIFATGNMVGKSMIIRHVAWYAGELRAPICISQHYNFLKKSAILEFVSLMFFLNERRIFLNVDHICYCTFSIFAQCIVHFLTVVNVEHKIPKMFIQTHIVPI